MGAWGCGIVESDTAYDYFDTLEPWFPSRQLYKIINDDATKEEISWTKEVFRNNKFALRKMALTSYESDKEVYMLIYTAFMRFFELDLDKEDLKEFDKAYEEQITHIEEWSPPKERELALKELKEAVDQNKRYNFSHEGLFEKIQKHIN